MSASDHLSPIQFKVEHHQYDRGEVGGAMGITRSIVAEHPEHGAVGRLSMGDTPEILDVHVNRQHQRQGIATGMYQHAVQQGWAPEHSGYRSDAGEAWAHHVGGTIPARRA